MFSVKQCRCLKHPVLHLSRVPLNEQSRDKVPQTPESTLLRLSLTIELLSLDLRKPPRKLSVQTTELTLLSFWTESTLTTGVADVHRKGTPNPKKEVPPTKESPSLGSRSQGFSVCLRRSGNYWTGAFSPSSDGMKRRGSLVLGKD